MNALMNSLSIKLWSYPRHGFVAMCIFANLACAAKLDALSLITNSTLYDSRPSCLNINKTASLRMLVYSDQSIHPVLVPSCAWSSSRITGAIVFILLHEVMGYSVNLVNVNTVLDDQPVNYVAGCVSPTDIECVERDVDRPQLHFTIESWMMGIRRYYLLPESVKPQLLGALDFSVDDSYFLWQNIVDDALYSDTPVLLNDYHFYNASQFTPSKYFDTWQRILQLIPAYALVPCSSMSPDGENERNTTLYTHVTKDPCIECYNDTVWFSPACRANNSLCVPLVVQYNIDNAMQLAWWYNLPLAVMMVDSGREDDYAEYNSAIRRGRFLFGHMSPISNLHDSAGRPPALLSLPRFNLLEQVAGIFRTGIEDIQPRNYGWRGLEAVDPRVAWFATHIDFFDNDMSVLMSTSGALQDAGANEISAAMSTACQWARANEATWRR